MVVVVVPIAAVSYLVELATAFFGLPAMFAVLLDGHAQIVFSPVKISLTFSFCPRRQGRANQADDRQQGYAKNSEGTSHFDFSFR